MLTEEQEKKVKTAPSHHSKYLKQSCVSNSIWKELIAIILPSFFLQHSMSKFHPTAAYIVCKKTNIVAKNWPFKYLLDTFISASN